VGSRRDTVVGSVAAAACQRAVLRQAADPRSNVVRAVLALAPLDVVVVVGVVLPSGGCAVDPGVVGGIVDMAAVLGSEALPCGSVEGLAVAFSAAGGEEGVQALGVGGRDLLWDVGVQPAAEGAPVDFWRCGSRHLAEPLPGGCAGQAGMMAGCLRGGCRRLNARPALLCVLVDIRRPRGWMLSIPAFASA
jgi:hypothetical protein